MFNLHAGLLIVRVIKSLKISVINSQQLRNNAKLHDRVLPWHNWKLKFTDFLKAQAYHLIIFKSEYKIQNIINELKIKIKLLKLLQQLEYLLFLCIFIIFTFFYLSCFLEVCFLTFITLPLLNKNQNVFERKEHLSK